MACHGIGHLFRDTSAIGDLLEGVPPGVVWLYALIDHTNLAHPSTKAFSRFD
jgi:hypothetical protein